MKTLCCMFLAILSVVADDGTVNFIDADETRRDLEAGDAPYFVAILYADMYVCNGVILTERFVLTAGNCVFQNHRVYNVVYGTIQFDSNISSDNKKEVKYVFAVHDGDGEINNKYTDGGSHHHHIHHDDDNNDNDNDDYNDNDDDNYADYMDYDSVRALVLSEIYVVKVDNPFSFNNIVNKINLPYSFEQVPADRGTLVFRSREQTLLSQRYPSVSETIELDDIEMYYGNVRVNEKHLMRGSPYVINNTLYGLLIVVEPDSTVLVNIPHVIERISYILDNY